MRAIKTTTISILALGLLAGLAVGVVAQDEAADPTMFSVPVGLDTSYFSGTWICESEFVGTEWVDGVQRNKSHNTCTTESTDPRVDGTGEWDRIAYGTLQGEGVPWTAVGVLTTAEGTWRGNGHGMATTGGASGLGMAGFAFGFGEMTYIGEGAYEGLVMRYYLAGHAGNTAVSGWVTPAE